MKVITTHTGADFDALSSLLAASKLYPDALLFIPGSPEKKVRKYLEEEGFPGKLAGFGEIRKARIDLLVVVDTRYNNRLGRIAGLITPATVLHIYDHHPRTDRDMAGKVDMMRRYGATTTILVEIIKRKKIELKPPEATLLAAGICEDTGSLKYPLTAQADRDALEYLKEIGADMDTVGKYLVHELSAEQERLERELAKNSDTLELGGLKVMLAAAQIGDYIEELSVVVHSMMDKYVPDAIFVLIRIKSAILCISRSRTKKIDVGSILSGMGGGGHPTAASASFEGEGYSSEELVEKIRAELERRYAGAGSVRSFPVKPLIVIPKFHTARKVSQTLRHLDIASAPVGDSRGNICGIVTREELDKAIRHGLSKHRVTEFMDTRIPVAEADILKSGIPGEFAGSPLVLFKEKGEISGMLEKKRGQEEFRSGIISVERESVQGRMSAYLDGEVMEIIEVCAGLADDMGTRAYCVGGMVRDIMMGIRHRDIDIVIERKGIEFARRLSSLLGGRLNCYYKFKTAIIKCRGREIDIATLRKEYYEFPAALPTVDEGTLLQDLYRRDFSINAMAIRLNPQREKGMLVDYLGGEEDLKRGVIRILYPLSFIEDPTRIFRAVRFEKRFGFAISRETLRQLKKTVSMKIHAQLTNERVREEILRIFEEDNPHDILRRLDRLGVLGCIHPDLTISESVYGCMARFADGTEALPGRVRALCAGKRREVLMLMLFSGLGKDEGVGVMKEFHFSGRAISCFVNAKKYTLRITRLLENNISRSRIFKALHNLRPETLLYIMSGSGRKTVADKIIDYLEDISGVTTETGGGDLIRMGYKPSAVFTRILFALKMAKINGKLPDRAAEEEFVLNNYKK
ncbi:MAG: DHH family phosphoesterase [Elusimicrobia bacterium]|nr:DHH family phosphoesterase [Elusimicrobiota bacterium]